MRLRLAGASPRAVGAAGSCSRASSSLTRRIVVLNLAGLVALLVGFLYLNQFRAGADRGARAEPADPGRDHRRRHRVLGDGRDGHHHDRSRPAPADAGGRDAPARRRGPSPLEFSINPERVAPLLRRLVTPDAHARAHLRPRGCAAARLPARFTPAATSCASTCRPCRSRTRASIERAWNGLRGLFRRKRSPVLEEIGPPNGRSLPEVQRALAGCAPASSARTRAARPSSRWRCRSSASAPSRGRCSSRRRAATSTPSSPPSGSRCSRSSSSRSFVMIVLSLLLAGTIVGPVRRLAEAAERVRRGVEGAPGDPGLHHALRRDRASLRRAARHDPRALQPHRGDRAVRGRRRP